MLRSWFALCAVMCGVFLSSPVCAQVTLESPTPGDTLTGIGVISGWACQAQRLTVRFDGAEPDIPILYGSSREDTRATCGTANTGFALLFNWNILGAGDHTLKLSVDGRVRLSRTITVVDYGEEVLKGADGEWTLEDWPRRGVDTVVGWSEARQNIGIVDILEDGSVPDPEPDPPAQTGIRALLGSWRFTHRLGSHEFTFTRIRTDTTGDLTAVGTAESGRVYNGWLVHHRSLP